MTCSHDVQYFRIQPRNCSRKVTVYKRNSGNLIDLHLQNETIKIEIVRSIDLQIFPYKVYNDLTLYTLANRYFATTQKGITFKDSYMRTAYITNRPQGLAPI